MSNPFFSQFTCLIHKEFFGNHYTFGSSTDLSKKKKELKMTRLYNKYKKDGHFLCASYLALLC